MPSESDSRPDNLNLLHLLRKLTAADHKRLDEVINPTQVTGSEKAYSNYIGRFHMATLNVLEMIDWEVLENLGLPDVEERKSRYARLEVDSAALGNPKIETNHLETIDGGKSGGLGALYVLEGSIHGGSILLKMLGERNMSDLPTSFLQGFGSESYPMWGRFTAWLQGLDVSSLDPVRLASDSKSAFEIFYHQFSPAD